MNSPTPHTRLSRDEAAAALRAAGFTITSATEWQSTLDWARNYAARKATSRRRAA